MIQEEDEELLHATLSSGVQSGDPRAVDSIDVGLRLLKNPLGQSGIVVLDGIVERSVAVTVCGVDVHLAREGQVHHGGGSTCL